MTEHTEKKCPECGQRLRFPKNVGGLVMACPSCGKKFSSDFKLGSAKRRGVHRKQSPAQRGLLMTIFELPSNIVSRIARLIFPK